MALPSADEKPFAAAWPGARYQPQLQKRGGRRLSSKREKAGPPAAGASPAFRQHTQSMRSARTTQGAPIRGDAIILMPGARRMLLGDCERLGNAACASSLEPEPIIGKPSRISEGLPSGACWPALVRLTPGGVGFCNRRGADVLCQLPSEIADVGLPSSALRSALRSALWVTASPSIRWVAASSGPGARRSRDCHEDMLLQAASCEIQSMIHAR